MATFGEKARDAHDAVTLAYAYVDTANNAMAAALRELERHARLTYGPEPTEAMQARAAVSNVRYRLGLATGQLVKS